MDLAAKERIEIEFWRASAEERPHANSLANILYGTAKARVFAEKLATYRALFGGAARILELGAGQGWASCMVKHAYPAAEVVATDLSPHAIASAPVWERVFDVRLDLAAACRSYATPFADGSFDLIFAYGAAHHFVRHGATFREIARLLRPGGAALYLHEPAAPALLRPLARWRVNQVRPEVPEDVLAVATLRGLARAAGLNLERRFAPSLQDRTPLALVYYLALRTLPFAQALLPCSVDIVIGKSA